MCLMIQLVILAIYLGKSFNNEAMKPKASFAHYITMVPLIDSMPEFFPKVPLPT